MVAMTSTAHSWPVSLRLHQFLALTKPRVTSLVIATTATGVCLAPGHLGALKIAIALAATALVVGAANTLNCYFERDVDALVVMLGWRRDTQKPLEPARAVNSRANELALSRWDRSAAPYRRSAAVWRWRGSRCAHAGARWTCLLVAADPDIDLKEHVQR